MNTVLLLGTTVPGMAPNLRALGGSWDAGASGWRVPADRAAEAATYIVPAKRAGGRRDVKRGRRVVVHAGGDYYSSGRYDSES